MEDYAFALQIIDQLNGVEEFHPNYYEERAARILDLADKHDVDSDKVFAVLVDALREDIKSHPNQERLAFLLAKNT